MAKPHIVGQGWHFQPIRHSNARRYGHAGGKYASISEKMMYGTPTERAEAYATFERRAIYDKPTKTEKKSRSFGKAHSPEYKEVLAGKKPFIEWMGDIPQEEIDFRIQEAKENGETLTEEQARQRLYEDTGYWESQWDAEIDYLTDEMNKRTKGLSRKDLWVADVKNFGWRQTSGTKFFKADNAKELLTQVLPDTDNHFRIFYDGKRGFKIQNFHHDSPIGREWYYIRPATTKERAEQGYSN